MPWSLLSLVILASLAAAVRGADAAPPPPNASLAYRWLDVALEATAREVDRNGARPTVLSRTLMIACTSMYDAWASYDPVALSVSHGAQLRRPEAERTDANRAAAIGYAVTRTLCYVYPDDAAWCRDRMKEFGLDPADESTDPATGPGLGNRIAAALIESRRKDGANQHGDEAGCNGKPYSDYTYYQPVNTATVTDPDRWQPIPFQAADGKTFTPGFLTPHWYRVKTFALTSPSQFRAPPPPKVGSPEMKAQVEECIRFNAELDDRTKAIVEFMRDGPRSTGQSGHWLRFAQDVSRRDGNDLATDVKLYFAVANVAADAFIAAWETKRFYDTSRPWTLARHYFGGQPIRGWAGVGKGAVDMKGEDWWPYSPRSFPTPPFPGYVSGHSTVSAACAVILASVTGSDRFGVTVVRKAGELTEPGVAWKEVPLEMPTFWSAAEMAGISRVMGGYHIQADNVEGLAMGRKVAEFSWPIMRAYFEGTRR